MDNLVFGTDGWRDLIGDKFTTANLSRVAQAYAEYLLEQGASTVVVGYDTRFNSPLFARRVAEVLAASGLRTLLSSSHIPTPVLSFAVKYYSAGGGVMLTASHNPPPYHGFKLKGPYGGGATQAIYEAVSARIPTLELQQVKVFDRSEHAIEAFDIRGAYYDTLAQLVDLDALRQFQGTIVHDAMGGAAGGWLAGFFEHANLPAKVQEVRSEPNALFYGVNPEPLPQNLAVTTELMKETEAVFATATDGDGDRLGVVLPGGEFFNSHQIFAVLVDLMSRRGSSGKIVKTFTVSRLVERLASVRGLEVLETPVGFKYIVDAMLDGEVLVGGEESGGIGVMGHLPERDGIANSLLLLEALVKRGESVMQIFRQLEDETGWKHAYDRLDLHLNTPIGRGMLIEFLKSVSHVGEYNVESVETLDGIKLNLSGHAWVLFRPSGTEPLLRVYCEAPTPEEVNIILQNAKSQVHSLDVKVSERGEGKTSHIV